MTTKRPWVAKGLAAVALLLAVVAGASYWRAAQREQREQAARELGCAPGCCQGQPTCTSYYYSPQFRKDTEDIYVRAELALEPHLGESMVDVGAGWGAVSLRLARAVGPTGHIYATDLDAGRLAEVDRRATEAAMLQVKTIAVADPWSIGLAGVPQRSQAGLLFCNSVNFKRDQAPQAIVAYLQQWRQLLAPGARVVYHTDWIDQWLLTETEVRQVFADAGFGQAERLAMPTGMQGSTCYCPQGSGPQPVTAGYLLRWRVR